MEREKRKGGGRSHTSCALQVKVELSDWEKRICNSIFRFIDLKHLDSQSYTPLKAEIRNLFKNSIQICMPGSVSYLVSWYNQIKKYLFLQQLSLPPSPVIKFTAVRVKRDGEHSQVFTKGVRLWDGPRSVAVGQGGRQRRWLWFYIELFSTRRKSRRWKSRQILTYAMRIEEK